MAVKFANKEKQELKIPQSISVSEQQDVEVALLVEQAYEIKKDLDNSKVLTKQLDAIKGKFKEMFPEHAGPEDEIVFTGVKHKVVFTEQAKKREITSVQKIHKMLGDKVFYALCSINLGDLDKYLSPDEIATVVKEEKNGARTFTIKEL
jgi:diaminopimelate epimerase